MGLEESVERVRAALIYRTGRKSYLNPKGLIEAIAKDLDDTPLTVKQCMGRLVKEAWLGGVSPDGIPFGHVKIIGHVPVSPIDSVSQQWLDFMDRNGITGNDRDALTPLSTKLAPFSDLEKSAILEGLLQLRANLLDEAGRHRFLVSAKYFLGSSKLLDELPSNALRAFGISIDFFPTHPLYVIVAGCSNPETVVLVENPAAFELAVKTNAVKRCAFIATFGFGLSKSQEDYGNQLASMAEDRFTNEITLMREGATCPAAKDLLVHPRITFWGDLDIAGIHIYLRLKKVIPGLSLSGLYKPMFDSLKVIEHSHPYVSAVGKAGQPKMATISSNSEEILDVLLSQCISRGVDQELLTIEQIEKYASLVLALNDVGIAKR